MDEIKLAIGTEVLVEKKREGVISRIAVHPLYPETQSWHSFEVTIVGAWRTRRTWHDGSDLRVLR